MIGLNLLGPIAGLASTWLEGHVETKKAKTEAKIIKIKSEATIKQRQATGEIDWDLEQAKASAHSWKDEFLTVIFCIPLCMSFIPGCEEIVKSGFDNLEKTPDWYRYSLGIIISASFGLRGATKFFNGKKK